MANPVTRPAALAGAGAGIGFASYRSRRAALPYLYAAPAIALFFLLMLFPMAMVFRYSLLEGAIMTPESDLCRSPELPGALLRSRVLGVDRPHALFLDRQRHLPSHHRAGLCADAEREAAEPHREKHPQGPLHPPLAVHRRHHRHHLAADSRSQRHRQLPADRPATSWTTRSSGSPRRRPRSTP